MAIETVEKEVIVKKVTDPTDPNFKEDFEEVKEAMADKVAQAEADAKSLDDDVPTKPKTVPMRQIVIETDGNGINIVKAETSGSIELTAVLQRVITFINQPSK